MKDGRSPSSDEEYHDSVSEEPAEMLADQRMEVANLEPRIKAGSETPRPMPQGNITPAS
jgi:hypothetical protein